MMKRFFLQLLSAGLGSLMAISAAAQSTTCKIKYNYDASGNRIKRFYGCDQNNVGTTEYRPDGIITNLSPNPTYGPLVGTFSMPIGGSAGSATVTIVTVGGIPVLQQTFSQVSSTFTVDIAQQMPGTYFLTVYAFDMMESYTITKL